MRSNIVSIKLAGSALLAMVFSASANATLGSSYQVSRSVDGTSGGVSFCNRYSATGAQIGCNGSQEINGTTYFYDGAVKAEDYGVLKGRGFLYASRATPPGSSIGTNERLGTIFGAWFDDSFIVASSAFGAAGTTGNLEFGFAMTGSTYQTAETLMQWSMGLHNLSTGQYVAQSSLSSPLPGTLTLGTTVTFGQSFNFRVNLTGRIDLNGVQRGGYDQQQASIDLFNTAQLLYVRGFDGAGVEVPIYVTALSGSTYQGALPVPEVSTWLTMSFGLIGIGLARRFKLLK